VININKRNRQMFITSYFLIFLVLLLFYGPMFHFKLIRRKECWNTCVLPVNLANFVPSCYCRPHCFRYFPWCWLFSFFSSNILQMTLLKLIKVIASSRTLYYIIVIILFFIKITQYCFIVRNKIIYILVIDLISYKCNKSKYYN